MIRIDRKLREYGFAIDQAHLYFVPHEPAPAPVYPVRLFHAADIAELKADERIDEAFPFEDFIEDVLGAAVEDERHGCWPWRAQRPTAIGCGRWV